MGKHKIIIMKVGAKLFGNCMCCKNEEGCIQETIEDSSTGHARILNLPTNILVEIFIRLPVQSILCCRCVCRTFSTVLKGNHFLNVYQAKPPCAMIMKDWRDCFTSPLYFFEFDDNLEGSTPKIVRANVPPTEGMLHVLGSCDGLVCVSEAFSSYWESRVIYICNPILGEYWKLPQVGRRDVPLSYGFGIDPSTNHYKVVRVLAERYPFKAGLVKTYAETFIVGIDTKWKTLKYENGPNLLGSQRQVLCQGMNILFGYGLAFRGVIHWRPDHGVYRVDPTSCDFICAFVLGLEKFGSIGAPIDMMRNGVGRLMILRDCLSTYCFTSHGGLNIWTMREYGVVESWSKDYSITENWVSNYISNHRFSCFVPAPSKIRGDAEILIFSRTAGLIRYNLDERKCTEVKIDGIKNVFDFEHDYIPSLTSLNNLLSGVGVKIQTVKKRRWLFSIN